MIVSSADIDAPDVQALLSLHLSKASRQSGSHALTVESLHGKAITLFCARGYDESLMGIAALKMLPTGQSNIKAGEIKSVRTHPNHLRRGVSRALMDHIHSYARENGLTQLYLETHPTPDYTAALALYKALGYRDCGPFGDYTDSPNSIFMRFDLTP